MLLQFKFENFKSHKKETILNMSASSIKQHPRNTILNEKSKHKERYLKTIAIHGANASGKSGILDAYFFMKDFVLNGANTRKNFNDKGAINYPRFEFDDESMKKTSLFEIFIFYKDKEYQYGFTIDNKKIYEEWLYKRDFRYIEKFKPIFERSEDEIVVYNSDGSENQQDAVEDNTLYLNFKSRVKGTEEGIVRDWFESTLTIGSSHFDGIEENIEESIPYEFLNSKSIKNNIIKFLKAIDIQIQGLEIEKYKNLRSDGKTGYKIYTLHKMKNKNTHKKLPLSEESSGTQKMFQLFIYIYLATRIGMPVFIDELDSKLHPLLVRYIIEMFHNNDKTKSQLIFTTHNTYNLTRDIFRRDQIYFVEKDIYGISEVFSLVEYKIDGKKIREDASFDKDYLEGKYGAIPLLQEFELWDDRNES